MFFCFVGKTTLRGDDSNFFYNFFLCPYMCVVPCGGRTLPAGETNHTHPTQVLEGGVDSMRPKLPAGETNQTIYTPQIGL